MYSARTWPTFRPPATVTGCGVSVTADDLPWTGSLNDGVATFTGFTMSAIGCTYSGNLTGSYAGPNRRHSTKSGAEDTSGGRIARVRSAFLVRAVRYLVTEAGIRQFLHIGTGLQSTDSTHEVAQRLAPESRIVYADSDPRVSAHAQAPDDRSPAGVTGIGSPEGTIDYIEAHVGHPDTILACAARTLDFSEPIALIMLGTLRQLPDTDHAQAVLQHLLTALPPGSYLVLSDSSHTKPASNETVADADASDFYQVRSPQQIAQFFAGLELIDPGLATIDTWRPDLTPTNPGDDQGDVICGIGRKPG